MFEKQKQKDFTDQALIVLKQMQQRDYKEMDLAMNMQKDEIITDLSFGRLALQIPEDHYEVLSMLYPDIQSSDATIKTLAWKTFMETDISLPYKVNKKMRKM